MVGRPYPALGPGERWVDGAAGGRRGSSQRRSRRLRRPQRAPGPATCGNCPAAVAEMAVDLRTLVSMPIHDDVVKALNEVIEALEANRRTYDAVQRQANAKLEDLRSHPDQPVREVIGRAERPLVVELLAESFGRLAAASAQLRRAEARALHREGMTMDEIAGLFGVTRQRVSA